jgi:hypothetical protein
MLANSPKVKQADATGSHVGAGLDGRNDAGTRRCGEWSAAGISAAARTARRGAWPRGRGGSSKVRRRAVLAGPKKAPRKNPQSVRFGSLSPAVPMPTEETARAGQLGGSTPRPDCRLRDDLKAGRDMILTPFPHQIRCAGSGCENLTGDAATILLTGWAQAAEPEDRVASATYVWLPKPRKIIERPPARRLRADVLLRTATMESKVGLLPSAPIRSLNEF